MRSLNLRDIGKLAIVSLVCIGVLSGCTEGEDNGNRERAVREREAQLSKAELVAPAPQPSNFPIRKALVKYTERQDLINHPWYIYIMGMDGTYLGYYVGQTYPVSTCNFLSSTEKIQDAYQTSLILTAPSYDGVYYGGGGASAACDSMFFFDVETDAMITFSTPLWFAADSPLDLDVKRLRPTNDVEVAPQPTPSPVSEE